MLEKEQNKKQKINESFLNIYRCLLRLLKVKAIKIMIGFTQSRERVRRKWMDLRREYDYGKEIMGH